MPRTVVCLESVYRKLLEHFGHLHWWPAHSPFEVVIGAILTQNTAWTNVEQAIANLRQADALDPESLSKLPPVGLEQIIRPAGYFRQKAERLQTISRLLVESWQGDVERWCSGPLEEARKRLLQCKGIGPETADSILLYAAGRPSFVVDAYTRRIFERVGLLAGGETYDEIRRIFMGQLPEDAELFNEYHAQIVQLAKSCCHKRKPNCGNCPLNAECTYGKQVI